MIEESEESILIFFNSLFQHGTRLVEHWGAATSAKKRSAEHLCL
jgi:hypothetical protein